MSLRTRLFALTVLVFASGMAIAGTLMPSLVRDYLVERLDERLPLLGIAASSRSAFGFEFAPPPGIAGASISVEGAYARIDVDGRVVFDGFLADGSFAGQVPDLGAASSLPTNQVAEVRGVGPGRRTSYRVLVVTGPSGGGRLTLAAPLTEVDATIDRIIRLELLVGVAVLGAVGAGVWTITGVGLRPLRAVEHSAASIRTGGFVRGTGGRRVEAAPARSELAGLTSTLNEMLDELDDEFARRVRSESRLRRFVADASHELRTPLTSIRGYAELCRRRPDDTAYLDLRLGRIVSESERLSTLVDDLLTLAHLDETPELELELVDLGELTSDLLADAAVADPSRAWRLGRGAGVVALVDRRRVAQAVVNLLANARVHTTAGTPVEVTVERTADAVRIAVVDHGTGVADEDKALVFDRFHRLDPGRARTSGGAGLGLAITSAVVAAHGGTAEVIDTPGGGATFSLWFPLRPRTS